MSGPPERATRGFTLIELMIVVAIVSVLAAVAIPVYSNYVAKAQFTEALSLASGAKSAVVDSYQERQKLDGLDNGVGSIPAAADISGHYVKQVDVVNGTVTATFAADSALAGNTMTLTPKMQGGTMTWACTTTAPAAKAPATCR